MLKKIIILLVMLMPSYTLAQVEVEKEKRFTIPPYVVNYVSPFAPLAETYPGFLTRRGDFKRIKEITGNGKGIKVGIVDTGVDADHRNGDLSGVVKAKDFTRSRWGWRDRAGHGCLIGGQIIYSTKNGLQTIQSLFEEVEGQDIYDEISHIKAIEDLGILTYSLDISEKIPKARKSLITHVHKLQHKGKLYNVKVAGETLSLTPWHPIYVITSHRGLDKTIRKIRADKLKVGDLICLVPKNNISLNEEYHNIDGIKLDENLALLMGLIISDGHISKRDGGYVGFVSNNNKHIELFDSLVKTIFDYQPKHYIDKRSGAVRSRIHNQFIRKLLIKLGIPSGAKSLVVGVPKLIQNSPKIVIEAFYAGCIEGDGSIDKTNGRVRLITGSDKFAEETKWLLNSIGLGCSKSLCISDKSNFGPSRTWHIRIPHWEGMLCKLRVKELPSDYVNTSKNRWSKAIQSISVIDYEGPMYDFTVDKTHNYVANGLIVSNTHVSGMIGAKANGKGIEGIASDCEIYMAKGLGDRGFGTETEISNAIRWLISEKVDIINLSIGGGYSQKIENAVKEAYNAGILVFAALGNDGTRSDGHPGNSLYTYGMAAINYDKKIAAFSSRSDKAFYSGYGVDIFSTISNGRYASYSGTSMATPDASGVAALLLGYSRKIGKPITNMREYYEFTLSGVEDLGVPNRDREYGFGFIDINKVIKEHEEELQPPPPVGPEPNPPVDPIPPVEPPSDSFENYNIVGKITVSGKEYLILEKKIGR